MFSSKKKLRSNFFFDGIISRDMLSSPSRREVRRHVWGLPQTDRWHRPQGDATYRSRVCGVAAFSRHERHTHC